MKQRIHRFVIWMLVMLMAAGSLAPAAMAQDTTPTTTNESERILFSDTITHWSQKHVAKLAALGIVNGIGDGKFGTNNNITQEQVIAMAVRLMGAEEEANQMSNVGMSLQVSDWARQYVLYALSKGLLVPAEEMANDGHLNWGSRSAKREWVAKVMVRAIGKQAEAEAAANVPTKFNDNADISADTIGYVNAAVDLGLITGNTQNNFLPLSTITRAETAAIFSRSEQYLPQSESVVKGYVSSITTDTLRVRDEAGDVHNISLSGQTAYYTYDNNFQVPKSDIRVNREVYVVQRDGSAIYVEVTSDEEPSETISGELKNVDIEYQIIKIYSDGEEISYLLAEQVAVIDVDGNGSSLSQLIPLSQLKLKKSTITNRIIEIVVTDKPLTKSSSGVIANINEEQITIRDIGTEQFETYPLHEQVLISYDSNLLMVSDLVVSDEISYKVVNGYITEIDITAKYVEPQRGKVDTLNIKNKTILIRNAEGKLDGYDLADSVQVRIDGMIAPTLEDIFPDDAVTLQFDGNERVNLIRVEDRMIETLQMLEFIAYIDSINKIIVVDNSNTDRTLTLTEDTILEVYGLEYPIEDLNKYISEKQRVDVTLNGDIVQRIKRSEGYVGTVKEYSPVNRRMVITHPSIGDIPLTLSQYAFVQIINQSSTTLSDVKVGDEVKVILDEEQKNVQQIHVKRNMQHTIENINIVSRLLTVRDMSNKLHYVSINSGVQIDHPTEPYVSLNDLKVGQTITVSYYGTSASAIHMVDTSYGKFENFDRTNNLLTILTNDNQFVQVKTDKQFELYRVNERIQPAALQTGERLVILTDKDGYSFARVVTKQMMFMHKLEANNRISFTNQLKEMSTYDLAANVIVRAGNTEIKLSDLKQNDTLNVYIVNNEVVEIEKL